MPLRYVRSESASRSYASTSSHLPCSRSFRFRTGSDSDLRYANPDEERINVPAESRHYWRYRLHLTLETLLAAEDYDERLRTMVAESGRVR